MASPPKLYPPRAEEGPWIEIIQKMELLYADLARMQTESETKTEELLRAKTFTDNIIRSMVNSLIVTDRDSVITMANDACCQLLGRARDQLIGKPLGTIFAEGAANPFRRGSETWNRCRSSGSASGLETLLKTERQEEIPVSVNASVMSDPTGETIGMVLVATDLREMRRLLLEARAAAAAEREQAAGRVRAYRELEALQAHLIQSEKMSSLGRMAASVAHEINNPLGAIVVYTHLLLETAPAEFSGRRNLEKIVREATRCRDIVRGLLDFARPGTGMFQAADLNRIVTAAHELLRGQTVLKQIAVDLELSQAPLEIVCDPNQLQQAFTNILFNAAESIQGRGAIAVLSWHDESRKRVAASVKDTGCGIPGDNLSRIFEPFFTTKQSCHGTGLGLAIVYGIVDRHGGEIDVDSHPGEGTTFTVWLPEKGPEEATRRATDSAPGRDRDEAWAVVPPGPPPPRREG
ncbi:MAG: PAS domain-containing protein [Candidatus Riflebacteria bacterium]|nr:PAS domain-containing protein [Candidatus Riflebacteria bacterium]